jgi:glycerophosphoryl diester phosphodiesterase
MSEPCAFIKEGGLRCRAAPLRDGRFCLMHDPDPGIAAKAAEARRLGGARRRHESTLAEVYDLAGLGSVAGIRRLIEVAVADALALDPGVGRLRVIIAGTGLAIRLLETADLARRVEALETYAARAKPTARSLGTESLLDERDS